LIGVGIGIENREWLETLRRYRERLRPRSNSDNAVLVALSGSQNKAPGSAGDYLLRIKVVTEASMRPEITKSSECREVETTERCFILEVSGPSDDNQVSIARARVAPGTTTAWHRLKGVVERYLIVSGSGRMSIQGLAPANVGPGDVVRIPAGTPQQITNFGSTDLIFYCICTPPFREECYESLE